MKRYMELICRLLAFAEGLESTGGTFPPEMSGFTPEQVHYHVQLCAEAGYLHVDKNAGVGSPYLRHRIMSLTWQGHEKLQELRGDNGSA